MKRIEHSHLPVAALSHPGMRGKNNEDRYGVLALQQEDPAKTPALLAVLSDGIGGHRAGEVAADMAVNLINAYVLENGEQVSPPQVLQQAIQTASLAIREQARANHQQEGMGATCACAYILGSRLYTANVGDSRIYLLRRGILRQLTSDHTWIKEALEQGVLTPEQAQGHPNTHVIRRFLGSPQPPEVDIRLWLNGSESDSQAAANQGTRLQPGDTLLLCSDGLTDLVADEEIAVALHDQPLTPAAAGLIDLANQRGGHDNITLILIQVPLLAEKPAPSARRWLVTGCLVLILVAGLAGLVIPAVLGLFERGQPTPTALVSPQNRLSPAPPLIIPQQSPAVTALLPTPRQSLPLPVSPTPVSPANTRTPDGPTLTPWPTNTRLP